jgi:diguanylate cyclase (GGDEF)-like protein/PAS domain S-box-containing protein
VAPERAETVDVPDSPTTNDPDVGSRRPSGGPGEHAPGPGGSDATGREARWTGARHGRRGGRGPHRTSGRAASARILIVGIIVIGVAGGVFVETSVSAARTRDDTAAEHLASAITSEVTTLFGQWRSEVLIAAQNEAFTSWSDPAQRPAARVHFESALLAIHELYPSRVGEACVIDRSGRELARQVNGEIAPVESLSPDERGNAFFGPTISLSPGVAYEDRPYVSPDTGDWVISVATPVMVDGTNEFVVHFEVPLEEIRRRLDNLVDGGGRARIVEPATGLVLVDTGSARHLGSAPLAQVATTEPITSAAMHERTVDPTRFEGLSSPNRWTIEAWVPHSEVFSTSFTAELLGLVGALGALVLLAVAQSKRATAVEALHLEEEQFRRAFDDSPVGMALSALDGTILRVNHALCTIVGVAVGDLLGHHSSEVPGAEVLHVETDDIAALVDGHTGVVKRERHYERDGGARIDCHVTVSLLMATNGTPARIVVQVVDETDASGLRRRLQHQATHDTLTGLPNRALLLERTTTALERARTVDSTVALIFLDLDHFKVVNDSLGHEAGDELLVAVGERLVEAVRAWDLVGRLGGDEFVVLCDPIEDTAAAETVAERITLLMSRPFVVRDRVLHVSASLGVALTTGAGVATPADLLREADTAAYRAKERGRARYELFDDAMRARAEAQLDLEDGLRNALMRGEFRVHYQPIVDLASGLIGGVEALVRWEHPDKGLLYPGSFIDVAEGSGLVVSLGLNVLDQVCRQLATWDRTLGARSPRTVTVNVSPRQLIEPDFVESVGEVFEATGVDPARICLEITENALMEDVDLSLGVLGALKVLGVDLAIDDFGTGHSSLSYLRRFPVDMVKIDQSFIQDLGVDRESSSIVEAVVNLAHVLGLTVVAEGIETIEHLVALAPLGCDKAQGYYFSRPCAPDVVTEMLATWEPHGPTAELNGGIARTVEALGAS